MLRLEINIGTKSTPQWEALYLKDDASINMEVNSPLWNNASTFSEQFNIPIEANRHILGSIDTMHGRSIYDALYDRQYRLWVEGMILSVGIIRLDEEVEVDEEGMVEIELTSGRKSLDDLLDGVSCRDIDMERERVVVGYVNAVKNGAINDPDSPVKDQGVEVTLKTRRMYYKSGVWGFLDSQQSTEKGHSGVFNTMQQLLLKLPIDQYEQILGKDRAAWMAQDERLKDFHNNNKGYDEGATFCHIPICFQLYEKVGDSWVAKRGYQNTDKYGDPGASDRPGSAPCFYVLYIIDLLFKQFGIPITDNGLKRVREVNRLAFVHTDWHVNYGDVVKYRYQDSPTGFIHDVILDKYVFMRYDGVAQANVFDFLPKDKDKFRSLFFAQSSTGQNGMYVQRQFERREGNTTFWKAYMVDTIGDRDAKEVSLLNPNVYYAIATSENLPDKDVSDVIHGLESMFGCRFIYDDEDGTLRIVMLRDVLSQNASIDLHVQDYAVHKKENNTRGFRLKYSASTTFQPNELQKILNDGDKIVTGDEDTNYNYNDWDKVKVMSADGKSDYGSLINSITCFDETCYVDRITGNAYRIKVDKEAETELSNDQQKGLEPSLFQVGGYGDVNIGDCSDDDFVEQVEIGFSPVVPNDMNFKKEKEYWSGSVDNTEGQAPTPVWPKYSVFSPEELHVGEESECNYQLSVKTVTDEWGNEHHLMLNVIEHFPSMPTGWDVTQGFDSPLQKTDYGLTVGILRPGSSEDSVIESNYDYDGRGNSQWMSVVSSGSQITSDSVDEYGNILSSVDGGIELSLKLKAAKYNPYHTATTEHPVYKMTYDPYKEWCDADGYFKIHDKAIARRGLYDQFYTEYAYWLLHRRIAVITIPRGGISVITLRNIDMTKKYKIGQYVGFINKMDYEIDKYGLGDVTIEMYYIASEK